MKYDEVISIGGSCDCRALIGKFKLSSYYYPLDWLWHHNIKSTINCIEHDFECFFDSIETNPKMSDPNCYNLIDKIYNVASIHEVKHNGNLEYGIEKIKQSREFIDFYNKMKRRVDRWNNIISDNNKKILFIRFDLFRIQSNTDINRLYDLLKSKHENMDFHYLYNKDFEYTNTNNDIITILVNKCHWGKWDEDSTYVSYIKNYLSD